MKNNALEYYRNIKEECKKWNRTHYSGLILHHKKRKAPWYMITTGKQYNYEERTESYGQAVQYYRVLSQAAKSYNKTIIKKTTHQQYISRLIDAKLQDWIKKNPCPIDMNSPQKDLFEAEYLPEWTERREKALKNITQIVTNMSNKVVVFARYKKDVGYPHKVMEFKSDGQKLMILDGAYANHLWSNSIKRAQKRANSLGRCNPDFVSLMVIDGCQKCILIPHKPMVRKKAA